MREMRRVARQRRRHLGWVLYSIVGELGGVGVDKTKLKGLKERVRYTGGLYVFKCTKYP